VERRYEPLVRDAVAGAEDARRSLVASPSRHRVIIAWLLIAPLIDDRDPARIAATRDLVRALSIVAIADRYLRSRLWWRRALGLRALGLVQIRERTAAVVAALDDRHPDVRGAALDALCDMQDPRSLPAIVVRMNDASLHRGRRGAALASFGSQCEALVLELSTIDPEHRLNYARVLGICGTAQSRTALCGWTGDERADVRAAAFEALGRIGLDPRSAMLALSALESGDVPVRAMAAMALQGWTGAGNAAAHLARHLDDTWTVAVRAARSLLSMHETGLAELRRWARRTDLAGLLARQMLWEAGAHR
jgi:HEAT repeat protein